jgi:hypothetical protein
MGIHHLNSVSACPAGGFLMDEMIKHSLRGRLVSQCLLIESQQGLVLIGTEYGLRDVGPEILLACLAGQTLGHAGIAVREADGWLFYAADAYFLHAEMKWKRPHCTPGLAACQTMMERARALRLDNQRRLRELRRQDGDEVRIFCAPAVHEFEHIGGRSHMTPAGSLSQRTAA